MTAVEPRQVPVGAFEKLVASVDARPALGSDTGATTATARHLAALLKKHRTALLTLDVFDTLLLRNDKSEARRFWELSELALEALPRGVRAKLATLDVYVARCEAMRVAYRTRPSVRGCREGHIDDVLRMQARMLGAPESFAKKLKSIEIEYESNSLSACAPLVKVAEDFAGRGGTVVLVSDMYLDGATIAELCDAVLDDTGFVSEILSSADVVISKRSGLVFPHMAERFDVAPDRILHVGDSRPGDFLRPREAGCVAVHFPVSDNELERRTADLDAFVRERLEDGVDVRAWAKI